MLANLPDEARYKSIFPPESQIVRLMVDKANERTLYGGIKQNVTQIRTLVWIPVSHSKRKKFILNCVKCSCSKTKTTMPLRGYLLKSRVDMPTKAIRENERIF